MKKVILLCVLLFVLVGLGYVALNTQYIADKAVSYSYQPSNGMAALLNDISLTDEGTFYAYTGRPQLSTQQEFNAKCDKKHTESIVLGCYISPYNIYVYDVDDERLQSVRQVTTAHEVLHVAYDRLSGEQKAKVNLLLDEATKMAEQTDPELSKRLAIYDQTQPGQRSNELHSIIGTEIADIPTELEEYYSRYFKDRKKVVEYALQYSKVFNALKESQDGLVRRLNDLKVEIDLLSREYNANVSILNEDVETFNDKASVQNGFQTQEQYDSARNDLVIRKNKLADDKNIVNAKIEEYNSKRDQLKALNVEVDELNSNLDSTKNPSI